MCVCVHLREGRGTERDREAAWTRGVEVGRHAWPRAQRRENLWPLVESTALSLLTGGTRDFKLNSTLKKSRAAPDYTRLHFQYREVNLRGEAFHFVAQPPLVCTGTSLTTSLALVSLTVWLPCYHSGAACLWKFVPRGRSRLVQRPETVCVCGVGGGSAFTEQPRGVPAHSTSDQLRVLSMRCRLAVFSPGPSPDSFTAPD